MLCGMKMTILHHLSAVLENKMPMQQKRNRNFLAPTVYRNSENFVLKICVRCVGMLVIGE